jgi:hypothetical protein
MPLQGIRAARAAAERRRSHHDRLAVRRAAGCRLDCLRAAAAAARCAWPVVRLHKLCQKCLQEAVLLVVVANGQIHAIKGV